MQVRETSKAYPERSLKHLLFFGRPQSVKALYNVSLELSSGQVTALLGPNGAGKTTLINIICGLTHADTGSVSVAGIPVPARTLEAQKKVGYVNTNDRSFFWRLTGRQNMEFFASLQGLTHRISRARTQEMLDRFGLSAQADQMFYTYSAGMKKRLGLGRAFMHDPEVILMDEATNGLDAQATEDLLDLVRNEIRSAGKSVLWSTHRAEEVEKICDRVIVLGDGQIRFDGSIEKFRQLCRKQAGFMVEIKLPDHAQQAVLALVESQGGQLIKSELSNYQEVTGIRDEKSLAYLLKAIIDKGATVRKVDHLAEPLHEVFIKLTTNQVEI